MAARPGAIETGRPKFLLWCGTVVGLAFMTKMLQGGMVVPALAAAYLLAGPPRLLTRVWQVALAGVGGSVSAALVRYLEAHQGSAKYLVAASGSMTTAPIIIQTGKAVVTIGGFNGGDPAPTVAQLEQMVAEGELRYVLLGGGGGFGGRGGESSSALRAWVQQHGKAVSGVSTGGATLYEVGA